MAESRCPVRAGSLAAVAGLGVGIVASLMPGVVGRADRIALRGGGHIRGKVLADPAQPDRVTVVTETGKVPLSFQKGQILRVQAEPSALDEYLGRRERADPTPDSQYELGLWCEQHNLPGLAEVHYEAALKLDKTYAPAHRKLGHIQLGDRWLWGDELREARGLVRYKGRWIPKEEKGRREAEAEAGAAQASWVRRLKVLRQAIQSGPDDHRREAERQLLEIRDPAAVGPLVQVFGGQGEALRALLDHVLEQIPGPEAAAALVAHVLHESDLDVRHTAISVLGRRKETNVVPGLSRALRSADPAVVNRAAWSLGQLNAVKAVPSLIPALITTRYQAVLDPSTSAMPGSITAGFGSISPLPGPATALGYGVSSYGFLTPPVVGPGVAAFGATSLPYVPYYPGGTLSAGGGPAASEPMPRLVPVRIQNVEVLSTLIKLTGQDFGYDVGAWRRWLASSFRSEPEPLRRVPQP